MKQEPISLSPSEWRVMEALWQGDATLMELVRMLGESAGWAKSTVTTMVKRMEAKGLIVHETDGRTKVFHANRQRAEVAAAETRSLLHRAYHGSVGLMVSTLVRDADLSQEELDELYAILRDTEKEGT